MQTRGFEPSAGRASSLLVNVPAAVTLLRVYLAELRGDAETTVDLVLRAMAARREGEVMLGTIIGWYAGMAGWLRGRPAEADRLLSPAAGQRTGRGEGRIPIGYLARLNRAFDTAAAKSESDPRRGRAPAVPGIVEPLTNRELEVLQMLAAGQSNQAIAGELVITLETVKKHVSHVLGKLGAANRTEAVARARELGLIA